MKIQCNACEVAEANVLCCADEAALCWACDVKVHAANKLASKHQRVSLSNSSGKMPKCDICQDSVGFFFCLEDRALLCRKCDVAIHTANSYVAGHQRYLLTGVKVGLQPTEPVVSSTKEKPDSVSRAVQRDTKSVSVSKKGGSVSWSGETSEVRCCPVVGIKGLQESKISSFSGGTTNGSNTEWPIDELLSLPDINHNYGYMEQGSSKADSCKISYSSTLQAADEDLDIDECLGQVPEIPWMVPEIPSPPTASGLFWPKSSSRHSAVEREISVPDLCSSYVHSATHDHSNITSSKRHRQC